MSKELTTLGALGAIKQMFGDKDTRSQALATIRESPGMALAVLADRSTELSLPARARAFDEVLGEIQDPGEAQKLVAEHFHTDMVNELLAARGGLPSAAVHTLDREAITAAMLYDAETAGNTEEAQAMIVLSWAQVLKDRPDWHEFLEAPASDEEADEDDLSIGDLLMLGLWFSRDRSDQTVQDIEGSEFAELGFDEPGEARRRLKQLLSTRRTVSMKVQALRLQIGDRQAQRKTADSAVTAQTAEAAKAVDVDLDL